MHPFVILCLATSLAGCESSENHAGAGSLAVASEARVTLAESHAALHVGGQGTVPPVCSDTAALLLARAVILAAPIIITDKDIYLNNGEPLRHFATTYRRFFEPTGGVVRCAAAAGPRLLARGIQTYDARAYDRVMSSAPPEIAHLSRDVADRINGSSAYLFELGQELSWLSQVLPSLARGDLAPFFNTGYPIRNYKRQQLTLAWPALQQMCAMGDCREMVSMVLPQMRQLVDEVAFGMIYAMVMMAG